MPRIDLVGVGKVMADVAFADRAEHRVGDRVREHVRIAMAVEAVRVRDLDAAENERAAFREAMHVVADAGESHVLNSEIDDARLEATTEILSGLSSRGVISNFPPAASTRSLPAATSQRLTDCSM